MKLIRKFELLLQVTFYLIQLAVNLICHEKCNTESSLYTCVRCLRYVKAVICITYMWAYEDGTLLAVRTPFSGFPLVFFLFFFTHFPLWRWQMINVWTRQLCIFLHNRKTLIPVKQRGVGKV